MEFSIPNKNNFCGGAFQDWLEVNLTDKCNGKCSWCVERSGYHPEHHAQWDELAMAIRTVGAKNVMLLGGEPTLYPLLRNLIYNISVYGGHKVWMTTNGSKLTGNFIKQNLSELTGINISIHHHDLSLNKEITGIALNEKTLINNIYTLHKLGIPTRLNCNCINGYIDDKDDILSYVRFAKSVGARNVRFAELKVDEDNFVDLAKIFDYRFGLNDDPFSLGCVIDTVIDEMPVNFRQMCGLQTSKRVKPANPKQYAKSVLYYDGVVYNGWQTQQTVQTVEGKELMIDKNRKRLRILLKDLETGKKKVAEAEMEIRKIIGEEIRDTKAIIVRPTAGGCYY